MIIHHGVDTIPTIKNPVVTTGTFDGVHLGHQKILTYLKDLARKSEGESVVITFWPHPRLILQPAQNIQSITDLNEKIALLDKQGIDHLVILPFTKELANSSSQTFINDVLITPLSTSILAIGYDHRFGKNREGSFQYLKENEHLYPFSIQEIPAQDIDEITVSSTSIREALNNNDLALANRLLGHTFSITGVVKKGDQIGRTIGYPTANLEVAEKNKLIPPNGAYASKVIIENRIYKGMLNIGMRPTVNGQNKSIEVNIFNFDASIYNQEITIELYKYIRKETKFTTIHQLKEQLHQDKQSVLNYFEYARI